MKDNAYWQVMGLVHGTLGFISEYQIMGVIPLDVVVHLFAGLILFKMMWTKGQPPWRAIFGVFLFALGKEWFDSYRLTASTEESIKDILVTMVFPIWYALLALITRIRASVR